MPQTFYDLLEVAQTATLPEIKAKYRDAARKYHPDVAGSGVQGARLFVQINEAYRVLFDPERRRHYDLSLGAAQAGKPPPPKPQPVDVALTLQQAEHAYFQGRMPEARNLCAKILKQDGHHAPALALLGDALVGLNKPAEAAVAFRLSLHIAPSALLQSKLARCAQSQARPPVAPPPSGLPKPGGLFQRLLHPDGPKKETP